MRSTRAHLLKHNTNVSRILAVCQPYVRRMSAIPNCPLCRFVLAFSKNNYTRTFQEHDVVYLFNKLLAVQAFEVIPTHDTIMWGNKFVPKERFGIIPIYV